MVKPNDGLFIGERCHCGRDASIATQRDLDGAIAFFCEFHYGWWLCENCDSDNETYKMACSTKSASLFANVPSDAPAIEGGANRVQQD